MIAQCHLNSRILWSSSLVRFFAESVHRVLNSQANTRWPAPSSDKRFMSTYTRDKRLTAPQLVAMNGQRKIVSLTTYSSAIANIIAP